MCTRQATFCYHKFDRLNLILLAFFSVSGCSLGAYISHLPDIHSFFLMRMAVTSPVSIIGLTFVILFPFVITAFAIWISKPLLLLVFSFFDSFSFTLILCYTISLFGVSGWLVCLMLLFSTITVQLCLFWIWIRYFSGLSGSVTEDLFMCFLGSLATGFIDYYFVAPYLVQLTSL